MLNLLNENYVNEIHIYFNDSTVDSNKYSLCGILFILY